MQQIDSPDNGTWVFGKRIKDQFGNWNWVVDAGDVVGHINSLSIYGPMPEDTDFRSTPVVAPKRGYIHEVLTKEGTDVTKGTPLLLVRIFGDHS